MNIFNHSKKKSNLFFLLLLAIFLLNSFISSEEFKDVFKLEKRINLEEKGYLIGDVTDLSIDSREGIWFIDWNQSLLYRYDSQSDRIHLIARAGKGPTDLEWPSSIWITPDDHVYVANYFKKVTVVDIKGKFVNSFLSTDGHLPACDIAVNSKGIIILGGNRYTDPNYKTQDADMIHIYSPQGKYMNSFCPKSELTYKLNLDNYRSVYFDVDSNSNIYVVQPLEYHISVYDIKGNLKQTFGQKNKFYKNPQYFYAKIKDNNSIREFSKKFTYTSNVFVYREKVLVLSQIYVGEKEQEYRFFIDIYDKQNGKIIYSGLETNMRLLKVKKDCFYFLKIEYLTDDEKQIIEVYKLHN